MNKPYENLALEGGGIWGIAYAGAFEALEQQGVLGQIKRVAGTSAGSIFGLLLALGYHPTEIAQIITELDFARFQDNGRVDRILTRYGYYQGNYARELFCSWVHDKLGDENATFEDLHAAGGLDLRVFATNLNSRHVYEFSYAKTRSIPLVEAVRASMSIPLYFAAVEIEGQIFVDGGTVFNYPLMGFGNDEIEKSLGLAFATSASVATSEQDNSGFGFRQPLQFIGRLVNVIERVQSPVFALHDELQRHTILIDTAGMSSMHFNLTKKEKTMLIENGRQAVNQHFNR